MLNTFISKEIILKNAIDKVRAKLESFKLKAFNDPELTNWNKWHDLEDRLTATLWDNWSAFKDWHWDKHNFNTYP